MTPTQYRRMVKHVDSHCLTVRLARTGVIRKQPEGAKTMKQILFLALFAVAVYAFGCWYFQDVCWLGDVSK